MCVLKGALSVILLLSALGGLPLDSPGETDAFFSPEDDVRQLLIDNINLCQDSLDAALSRFDSGELALALVKAKERGVKVRIVVNEGLDAEEASLMNYLKEEGLEVRRLRGRAGGVMNNNFVLFDGKRIITGSYSWTERSQRFDLENITLTDEPPVITRYLQEFDRLFAKEKGLQEVPSEGVTPDLSKRGPEERMVGKELIDISPEELNQIFGPEAPLSPREKKGRWEQYRGKYVRWQGVVTYRSMGLMDWYKVGFSFNGEQTDVEVSFSWRSQKRVLQLKPGDRVIYTGRLLQRKGRGSPYRLDDGEIVGP